MQHRNRNGLSVLDVIVTIFVLVTLVALLLPGVSTPREASRRSQCKNNLKQIGLSLMNYHDVHRTFPPGWIVSEEKEQSSGFGWGYHILPFFDQAPLFKKLNAKVRMADSKTDNAKLIGTILTAYRCPSDSGVNQAKSKWCQKIGVTNYVGNFGVGLPSTYSTAKADEPTLRKKDHLQGILGPNSKVRIRDVKDGMSNVILTGERRLPTNHGTDWPPLRSEGNFNSYWAGLPDVSLVNPLTIVATATGGDPEVNGPDDPLNRAGNLNALNSPDWKRRLPYFGVNRGDGGELFGEPSETTPVSAGFSSWHTGGAQVVLGDGTVRFISENVDPTVFTNMMRHSDGETLGEF